MNPRLLLYVAYVRAAQTILALAATLSTIGRLRPARWRAAE